MNMNVALRPAATYLMCAFLLGGLPSCRADQGVTPAARAKTEPAARPKARTAAARAIEEAEGEGDLSYVAKGDKAGLGSASAPKGKDWNGWRYRGDRGTCFFQAGRACAETFEDACRLARCADDEVCKRSGEAPVRVACGAK